MIARLRPSDLEVETQFYRSAGDAFQEGYPRRKFKFINDERNAIRRGGGNTRGAWDLNHDKIGNGHALYYKGHSYRMTSQYLYSDIG